MTRQAPPTRSPARVRWATSLALALAALGVGVGMAVPSNDVVELLSATDGPPDKSLIENVMGDSAVDDLVEIAMDNSPDADPGLRIQALASLRHFDEEPDSETARVALEAAVNQYRGVGLTGVELLFLRSSMVSLATVDGETSVDNLEGLLKHPSRDIRAACAQALGITGSTAAIGPLRERALEEPEVQVQLAIADALFVLESD